MVQVDPLQLASQSYSEAALINNSPVFKICPVLKSLRNFFFTPHPLQANTNSPQIEKNVSHTIAVEGSYTASALVINPWDIYKLYPAPGPSVRPN